jgi:hypothetical protein
MARTLGRSTSRRRRRTLLGVLSVVALVMVVVAPTAQAVHDLDFQLDGNIADDSTDPQFDWASFFDSSGQEIPALPDPSRPGFKQSTFSQDFVPGAFGPDRTTFTTGSKDILNITPGWQCARSNNVNDKIDLLNAYAVTFTDPITEDQILYFGMERFSNAGDANVGFWFLQDPTVGCLAPASGPSTTSFTGNHVNGDLLIVSAFTKGGDVSSVDVFEWVGGANGSLNTEASVTGFDCKDTTDPGDAVCATVNDPDNGAITPPWPTEDKDGDSSLDVSEFFEGGLNLSHPDIDLGDQCFTTFMSDTRSSQSPTATLFDFTLGTLPACGVEINTTPSSTAITLGDTVSDHAVVTGTGLANAPVPTGTMKFFICGPDELDAAADPNDDPLLCDVGGTAVNGATSGTADEPLAADATTPNPSDAFADSAAFEPDAVGTWCWRGVYSGEKVDPAPPNNYDPATDFDASECLTVADTTSASTAQNWLPNDSATITSDGGSDLDGTVTFTLFDSGNCTGNVLYTEDVDVPAATASGSSFSTTNGDNDPVGGDVLFEFTDAQPVTVSWLAEFDGTPADSTAPCESSTLTIDDDITQPPPAP